MNDLIVLSLVIAAAQAGLIASPSDVLPLATGGYTPYDAPGASNPPLVAPSSSYQAQDELGNVNREKREAPTPSSALRPAPAQDELGNVNRVKREAPPPAPAPAPTQDELGNVNYGFT